MRIHIVQKGDTLWTIAKKYGVDFEELKKMNAQLSNPEMVMPGMKIKVPGGGGAHKKEMPHKPQNVKKEMPKEMPKAMPQPTPQPMPQPHPTPKETPKVMPKAEHPFIQKKEAPKAVVKPPKEVKKEMEKEKPHYIYQPVMPQLPPQMPPSLPEIDINNYYMMNMTQKQAQVQQQPLPPKTEVKKEYIEKPVPMPVPMPVMPVQEAPCPPPMYHNYCYPMPQIKPFCDPCYPYPQHHHMHMHSQQWMPQMPQMMMPQQMPMPLQQMPMQHMPMQHMPSALPGMSEAQYPGTASQFDDESPDYPQFGQYGSMGGEFGNMDNDYQAAMPMSQMPYQPYQGVMPSFQAPHQTPAVGYQMPMTGGQDCGCGGKPYGNYAAPQQFMSPSFQQMPPNPYHQSYGPTMPEGAGTYAMPVRHDIEDEDE